MTGLCFAGRCRLWSLVLSLVMVVAGWAVPVRAVAAAVGTGVPDAVTIQVPSQVTSPDVYQSFVKASYQDFLGRLPSASEVSFQSNALVTGTVSMTNYLTALATSDEWLRVIVTKMYSDTLGRAPDAAGLAYWVGLLRAGTYSVAQVASLFYASDEYYIYHAGNSATSWVTLLYQKLLNRVPDDAGLSAWVSYTDNPRYGKSWVAYQFFQSLESRLLRVEALYQALLYRGPDAVGWPFWAQSVLASGDLTLAVNLAGSQEYWQRAQARFLSAPVIVTASLPAGVVGSVYSATLAGSGGATPFSWSATGLPEGLSLDSATGVVSGTPTTVGSSSVAVSLTDAGKQTVTKTLTLTVTAASLVPAPTIATVSPATGTVTGGVVVTITGSNLADVASITFGGVAGTMVTPVSATQVTVVTPVHGAGAVDVAVTTPGGTATSVAGFTYQAVVPPGPVTGVSAIPASTSIALSWTNPADASFTGVMIRRALGATPPATATEGTLVVDAAKPATSYTNTGLASLTQYSYALFAHDGTPLYATAATATSTTTAAETGGAVSGTVKDAGGTHHGLAHVQVTVRNGAVVERYASTAADGTWSMTGLSAGTYWVCFETFGAATGGSSDALGYADQCYNNTPPVWGSTTPVSVTVGATTTEINANLVALGAISGTVTDAGGTHHGLANVWVHMFSPTTAANGDAYTAADGSYTVTHLTPVWDYKVCFLASGAGATGGSSDALGYVEQCTTSVGVSSGATTTGFNAALAGAGAVSGTVTDAGGTHHGLAGVWVLVTSASTDASGAAYTAADGSYTVTGLASVTDYKVHFYGSGVTGGSSDATGYFDQYYDNQTSDAAATPVTVALGATRTGINAALIGKP